jgi:ABC-type dipeptide/oligopeptide/nickel transport system ATPase component
MLAYFFIRSIREQGAWIWLPTQAGTRASRISFGWSEGPCRHRPRLLVPDEPTAALEVSVPAVVLQLPDRLRREDDLAFLFISHDLNVVRMMCDRTIVLQNGRILEQGESGGMFDNPKAAYTRELVEAVPHIEPELAAFAT